MLHMEFKPILPALLLEKERVWVTWNYSYTSVSTALSDTKLSDGT